MDETEIQALVQIYTDLGNIIRAYRNLSILNNAYHHNRPLCERMQEAAQSINDSAQKLTSKNIHIDTKQIWDPKPVSVQGTSAIKKWQMTSFMQEIIQLRESVAQSLTQKDISLTDELAAPSWWERQLILKGKQGRTQFAVGFFGVILLSNLAFFAYLFFL